VKRVWQMPAYSTLTMRAIAEHIRDRKEPVEVEVRDPTRNSSQNRILHASLTDIATQAAWKGEKLSVDVWKRLALGAWMRESGRQPLMIPALDGKGFDIIYERSSNLSVKECSEFLEWVLALGSELGVKFTTNEQPWGST
jgi:hypothetical protein